MTVQTSTMVGSGLYPRTDGRGAPSSSRLIGALPSFLRVVAQQPDLEATVAAIAEQLVANLGAVTSAVYLVDGASSRTLRLAASQNLTNGGEVEVLDIDVSSLPAALAARTHALQLVGNASGPVSRPRDQVGLARCEAATVFALPLLVGDRLLGAVSAEVTTRLEPELLESLGAVLGAIVDRARLAEELHDRDEWMRVIAHEVRQPLNAMSLHGRWLSRTMTEGPASGSVRQVLEGVKRVNRLVGDLLDTALNDIKGVEIYPRPTDLVMLAKELAASGDIDGAPHVRVEAGPDVPEIDVDPERIEQVLANLLVNAVKYGRPNSEIRLDIERRGDVVALSVTNQGEDIPEREQASIFDRYYRAHHGAADGWGIGLYVCHGLVEAHGGRISVASGGGSTTFCVELPLALPQRSPLRASAPPRQ